MPRLPVVGVQPPLRFIPPLRRPWVRLLLRSLLPLLHRCQGVWRIEVAGGIELARLFWAHQRGELRLLLAFRHPSTRDPLVLAWLFWSALPRLARRQGLRLSRPSHALFLYDRGVPLWAGAAVGWLLSRLGGIPIQRGKLDRQALRLARDVAARGPFPLAIAPEGATNEHGDLIAPLEPGLAQIAFWTCDDLAAAGRDEPVLIVPIGVRYELLRPSWQRIDQLLLLLERQLGVGAAAAGDPACLSPQARRYSRLQAVSMALLGAMEVFYRQAHGLVFDPTAPFIERLARLREAMLGLAEARFGLRPQGTLQERCRRIEQAGWERIYRSDRQELSPVALGLADWTAAEASLCLEHMHLVEPFAAISGHYVAEAPTVDRYAEVLQILWRAVAWIEGRPGASPPSLGRSRARLQVQAPIEVTERHSAYRRDRRQAVEALTAQVRQGLEATLVQSGVDGASVRLPTSSP